MKSILTTAALLCASLAVAAPQHHHHHAKPQPRPVPAKPEPKPVQYKGYGSSNQQAKPKPQPGHNIGKPGNHHPGHAKPEPKTQVKGYTPSNEKGDDLSGGKLSGTIGNLGSPKTNHRTPDGKIIKLGYGGVNYTSTQDKKEDKKERK